MRENLTAHFLKEYFMDNSFYKLRELDGRIKDPEQRIANDIEEICKTVASMFTEAAQPALDLLAYGAPPTFWPLHDCKRIDHPRAYLTTQ